jgi:hypothetical protein
MPWFWANRSKANSLSTWMNITNMREKSMKRTN